MQYTAARFVIATATFCAVAEKTAADATAQWEKLLAGNHVTADDIDTTPRLALVDDATSPTAWAIVDEYYDLGDECDMEVVAFELLSSMKSSLHC